MLHFPIVDLPMLNTGEKREAVALLGRACRETGNITLLAPDGMAGLEVRQ